MANNATMRMTVSMPSNRLTCSNVSRCWPLWKSMPTSPMTSPSTIEMMPRNGEEPTSALTVRKATTMSAK